MILTLAKMETELIQSENRLHYKELQDNINEATELSDSYREILYDQITMYHTMMSTKLNDIMRTLTVFQSFSFPSLLLSAFTVPISIICPKFTGIMAILPCGES